jgi:hypothetical protein
MLVRPGASRKEAEVVFHSAGLFPVRQHGTEIETVAALDCLDVFARATYPVVANSELLQMIPRDVAKACGNLIRGLTGLEGAAHQATRQGLFHLCTTGISAGVLESTPQTSPATIENALAWSDQCKGTVGLKRLYS